MGAVVPNVEFERRRITREIDTLRGKYPKDAEIDRAAADARDYVLIAGSTIECRNALIRFEAMVDKYIAETDLGGCQGG
jgi:hypothetical protein